MLCIILQGLPGSGKSTFIEEYTKTGLIQQVEVCSADDYHMIEGKYWWKRENAGAAHAACFEKFELVTRKHLASTTPHYSEYGGFVDPADAVFVDNTNINLWAMYSYIALANLRDYAIEVHTFDCSVETSLERNVHNVPFDTIYGMERDMEPPPSFWPCKHFYHWEDGKVVENKGGFHTEVVKVGNNWIERK